MNVLFLFASSALALLNHLLGSCTDSAHCSLNGDCIDGVCKCDQAWDATPDCSMLSLVPTSKNAGYQNKTGISWGGYPILDEKTGEWNLMVSEMQYGCNLGHWTQASAIVRATSRKVEGPYVHQEIVIPPFAHDATIRRANDGNHVKED